MDSISFGTRYTYLVKGKPENLTKVKDLASLHGPGAIKKDLFVLSVADTEIFNKSEIQEILAAFKTTCSEQEVKFLRIGAPIRGLLKRLLNK